MVNKNLNEILQALDKLANASYPSFITFLAAGLNGTGNVALVPPKLPNGASPLYRALPGMRVVAAIDLTNLTNLQTSFEQSISVADSIKQQNSTNLTASSLLFILQG